MYFCWHTHKKTENCKIAFSQQTRRAAHFHGSTSPRRLTGKYASERVSERAAMRCVHQRQQEQQKQQQQDGAERTHWRRLQSDDRCDVVWQSLPALYKCVCALLGAPPSECVCVCEKNESRKEPRAGQHCELRSAFDDYTMCNRNRTNPKKMR